MQSKTKLFLVSIGAKPGIAISDQEAALTLMLSAENPVDEMPLASLEQQRYPGSERHGEAIPYS